MRELRLRAAHGETPSVDITTTGLLGEVVVPVPRKQKLWVQFCENAKRTGYVDLHWNQLQHVPVEILAITSLVDLRLSNNMLESLPEEIGLLSQLKVLHVTNNKLRSLPEAAGSEERAAGAPTTPTRAEPGGGTSAFRLDPFTHAACVHRSSFLGRPSQMRARWH